MKKYIFWCALVSIIFFTKIPEAYSNFYAEDGAFYGVAEELSLWQSFADISSGYLIFVSSLIANTVTLFPPSIVSIANAIIVSFFAGLLVFRTYENLTPLLESWMLRTIGSLTLILLPINNFENLASGTAIHFQLLLVTLLISIRRQRCERISRIDNSLVVIACLSDPFAIISLTPFLLHKLRTTRQSVSLLLKDTLFLTVICALTIQFGFILHTYLVGEGRSLSSNSISKVGYLYLDRVVGSSLIPNWGFVSSDDFLFNELNDKLFLRTTISILVFLLIVTSLIYVLRYRQVLGDSFRIRSIYWLFFPPLFYWTLCGFLFNPEPRYALFPGCSLVLIVLILSELVATQRRVPQKVASNLVIFGIILTWAFSFEPSERIIEGPSWRAQYDYIVNQCESVINGQFFISIRPVDDAWKVWFECRNGKISLD